MDKNIESKKIGTIKEELADTDIKDLTSFIKEYEADERSGVIKLVETARKRLNSN